MEQRGNDSDARPRPSKVTGCRSGRTQGAALITHTNFYWVNFLIVINFFKISLQGCITACQNIGAGRSPFGLTASLYS
jgi:hypothetical protein